LRVVGACTLKSIVVSGGVTFTCRVSR
jgi:hypothetical protein